MYHFLGDAVAPLNLKTVSSNVFTDPEIATVGYTQADVDARQDRRPGREAAAAAQPAREDAGHPGRLRQDLLPPGHRHRGRRRGRRAARQRADPPHLDRGRQQSDGRTDRERLHRVPVSVGLDRRGGAAAAHPEGGRARPDAGCDPAGRGELPACAATVSVRWPPIPLRGAVCANNFCYSAQTAETRRSLGLLSVSCSLQNVAN